MGNRSMGRGRALRWRRTAAASTRRCATSGGTGLTLQLALLPPAQTTLRAVTDSAAFAIRRCSGRFCSRFCRSRIGGFGRWRGNNRLRNRSLNRRLHGGRLYWRRRFFRLGLGLAFGRCTLGFLHGCCRFDSDGFWRGRHGSNFNSRCSFDDRRGFYLRLSLAHGHDFGQGSRGFLFRRLLGGGFFGGAFFGRRGIAFRCRGKFGKGILAHKSGQKGVRKARQRPHRSVQNWRTRSACRRSHLGCRKASPAARRWWDHQS